MTDGALQAAVVLLKGERERKELRLPFALDSMRFPGRCSKEMYAWVRYAPGRQAEEQELKLDIDLCDAAGNICVQMQGLSWRVLNHEMGRAAVADKAMGSLLFTPVWESSAVELSRHGE